MTREHLLQLLTNALYEDCPDDDISANLVLDEKQEGKAKIVSKSKGIFYGEEVIEALFHICDPHAKITILKHNGDTVAPGEIICTIKSYSKTILKIERVLLNFLQRLSGIATITHQYVQYLHNPNIHILDTRKTTPMMRFLEKKAVVAGGGYNHRFSLSDMVLLKENHLHELRKAHQIHRLGQIIHDFKKANPRVLVEIEIETLQELNELDLSDVDIIMFDNFSLEDIPKAILLCQEKGYHAQLEVSGNIGFDNIHLYAHFPIHRISIGNITHSVKALDLSLLCYD